MGVPSAPPGGDVICKLAHPILFSAPFAMLPWGAAQALWLILSPEYFILAAILIG